MEIDDREKKEKKTKNRLSLTTISEGLKIGIRKDGRKYAVRDDRSRYFFPEEWIKFYYSLDIHRQPIFDALINTGSRISEILEIKPSDFDFERNTLTLRVTKKKHALEERVGKKRTFVISSQFAKRMRKYISDNDIGNNQILFSITKQAIYQILRRTLKKLEFKDWYNFSLHNIRKTHGNWLKALDVSSDEICLRLGHDHNTYLKHYGSASIFDRKDKLLMIKILGDVYGFK
jgi:integrase